MNKITIIPLLCAVLFTAGCGTGPAETADPEKETPDSVSTKIPDEQSTGETQMIQAVYPASKAESISSEAFLTGESHWDW